MRLVVADLNPAMMAPNPRESRRKGRPAVRPYESREEAVDPLAGFALQCGAQKGEKP